MKKITLYLTIAVGFFAWNVDAHARGLAYDENSFPEDFGATSFCSAELDSDGAVCGRYGTGGDVEQTACRTDQNNGWRKKDAPCKVTGSSVARCFPQKNRAGDWVSSCAAWECQSGYLLWTRLYNKKDGLEIIGDTTRRVVSMGACKLKSRLQARCDAGCGCEPDEKCVLNEVVVRNHGKNVAAFIGDEMCVCKKSGAPVIPETCETKYAGYPRAIDCCNAELAGKNVKWIGDKAAGYCKCNDENKIWDEATKQCIEKDNNAEIECWYTLNVAIQCKNGNYFNKNVLVKLAESKVKQESCELLKKDMQNLERLVTVSSGEIKSYSNLIKSVCGDNSTSILPYSEADLKAARETLKSFFANANENASVWKTEAGNFNGARLASDLTAGVVLGTVGGVVSSKVIKKKQIEKGFEVLHCTIGGQTAADWGDTFTVGLNKYNN